MHWSAVSFLLASVSVAVAPPSGHSVALTALLREETRAVVAEAASSVWLGRAIAIVVTWSSRPLDFLVELGPALEHVALALYRKGGPAGLGGVSNQSSCVDAVPPALRPHVAICVDAYNAEGREAHTMSLFSRDFYDTPPRVAVFVHDHGGPWLRVLHAAAASRAAAGDWAGAVESQRPPLFRSFDTCLCARAVERNWREYGPRKPAMEWVMRSLLGWDDAGTRWSNLAFPPGAILAVPASALRSRPRVVYAVLHDLVNGSEARGVGTDPLLAFSAVPRGGSPLHPRLWQPFSWAHNLERLWFAVFDVDYNPDHEDGGA